MPVVVVGSTCLAQEALAGLAARENFNKVQLRKADSFSEGSTPGGAKFLPYNEKMLLHIKGVYLYMNLDQSLLVFCIFHGCQS